MYAAAVGPNQLGLLTDWQLYDAFLLLLRAGNVRPTTDELPESKELEPDGQEEIRRTVE